MAYFYSVPSIHVSVFVSLSCHFDYCSFEILSKIWEDYASCLVLFPQDCLGSSGSFIVPCTFRIICASSVKNAMGNLTGIALNL